MDGHTLKISVIIPAHNEELVISRALEAIKRQDYPDYETIVVDNASMDTTSEIARSYGVKVLREERRGTMWACECGRQAASGEIIVRMDADCLPEPDWLSRGARHFTDTRVVGVSGPYDYHDASRIFRPISLLAQKIIYPIVNVILRALGMGAIMIGGNTFLRAETLREMNGFNTSLTFYGDDTDTAKRAARFGKIIFDPSLVVMTSTPNERRFGGNKKVYKYWLHFFRVILSK